MKSRMKWAGHVERMKEDRLSMIALHRGLLYVNPERDGERESEREREMEREIYREIDR